MKKFVKTLSLSAASLGLIVWSGGIAVFGSPIWR
jgi:hypothetical protein